MIDQLCEHLETMPKQRASDQQYQAARQQSAAQQQRATQQYRASQQRHTTQQQDQTTLSQRWPIQEKKNKRPREDEGKETDSTTTDMPKKVKKAKYKDQTILDDFYKKL